MWPYIKRYLPIAVIGALFMVGEVTMDLLQPDRMGRIVDEGILGLNNGGASDLSLIWQLGIQMVILVLIGGVCGSLNNVFVHQASQNIGNEIRKDCFRRIMRFSFPQIDRFGTGTLITRMTNDITQVQNYVSMFFRGLIRTGMLTLGSLFFMFRLNRTFGLAVLCVIPFVLLCMAICLRKSGPLFTRLQGQLDEINTIMQEDVSGIRIIKSCVREVYEKVRFGKANEELIRTQLKVLILFAMMNPIIFALMYLAIAAILLLGNLQVSAGATSPGEIMAAITYTTQLLNGLTMLTMLFQNISRGSASWKRLREILQSEPEMTDGSFAGETSRKGEIEFRDVSFCYPESKQMVLHHINLTIHRGETVALMGATGSGKSTLANLIPRFYDVTEGTVLVDGTDVREYQQTALREKIAVAMQETRLFSASVRENIAWGRPEASETELRSAAEAAQASAFITALPEDMDTPVAERGMSLSGGQRQRLSLARALVKDAEILIFDDSTSALDLKTEAALYAAVNAARPDCTKLIIAQRIASVRQADRIVVLDHGGIAGCGTHEELLKNCPPYQEIYRSQFGKEKETYG